MLHQRASSFSSLSPHPTPLCPYHLYDPVCFVEWKCLLSALMRIREKVCFAPNESWHRYSSRVRSRPHHDSHYSPLFLHDDMEQIDRLKKSFNSISSAVESNLCSTTIPNSKKYCLLQLTQSCKMSLIQAVESCAQHSYSSTGLEINYILVSDCLCLQ